MSLSEAQDWAVRGIAQRGGPITAGRVGKIMLTRPGLDTTGKKYSPYTLGRMGGGMISNLKKNGMVKSKKVCGVTVCCLTTNGQRYATPRPEQGVPQDLAEFLDTFI